MKKFESPLNRKRPAIEGENKLVEDVRLLTELREHYGLHEVKGLETWLNLSLFLARDFVPGLQHRAKQGARVNTQKGSILLAMIADTMEKHDCGHKEAIRIMDQSRDGRHYYEQCRHLKKNHPDFVRALEELESK